MATTALAIVLAVSAGAVALDRSSSKPPAPGAIAAAAAPTSIDIGFCQDMTAHHGQAILMAENVIGRASPRVRTLAVSMLGGQSQESGLMKGWLMRWGASPLSSAPMAWMHDASGAPGTMEAMGAGGSRMHGMASQRELAKLATERGTTLDVTFLQLMLRHHEAGIAMAEYAQAHSRDDLVRGVAAEMAVDQTNEMLLMRHLLTEDGGRPLPMN